MAHSAPVGCVPVSVQFYVGAWPKHKAAAPWSNLVSDHHGCYVGWNVVNVDVVFFL